MSELLDNLYKEYTLLKDKIDKVAGLIEAYGGVLPDNDATTINEVEDFDMFIAFPTTGTWKEKISYVLSERKKALTAAEITEHIYKYQRKDDSFPKEKILNMVTQVASAMGVDGTLRVDSGYRNKYSIKE